jgi:hypothetical protein
MYSHEDEKRYQNRIRSIIQNTYLAFVPNKAGTPPHVNFAQLHCAFPGLAYVHGLHYKAEALEGSLHALCEQYTNETERVKKMLSDTKERVSQTLDEYKSRSNEKIGEMSQHIAEARKDWDEVSDSYKVHLTLKKPAEYWEGKEKKHASREKVLAVAIAMLTIVLIFAIYEEVTYVLLPQLARGIPTLAERYGYEVTETTPEPLSYLPSISLILITASIFLMILRPLLKLYMSNVHMADVARERVVMIRTYQTMYKEEIIQDKEDRHIILNALFQHSTSGLIDGKDDSGTQQDPISVIASLGKKI